MDNKNSQVEAAAFTGTTDLAAERLGGKVLYANDEFFAEKENLLKPGRGVFIADKYTERGKWMDGWETRRKRVPGHDWCVLKLGIAGKIQGVDIDTNHFLGNNPAYASVEAAEVHDDILLADLIDDNFQWTEILPKVALKPGSQNIFAVASDKRWTHLRLNIYPDGGVARFRVHGEPVPDWDRIGTNQEIDLAAVENGGKVTCASDMFFGNKDNLIMPGRSENMGDGWETKRRRGPGHDWSIIKLGHAGSLKKVEVDTNHFKGNYPDNCWLEGVYAPDAEITLLNWNQFEWKMILPQHKLQAHHQHYFDVQKENQGPWTHVRLSIAPDGGVSRLRLFGMLSQKQEKKEAAKSGAKSY
ncbi:MAG: allantoicase [Candidatus Obscuribacterales bacterium]|nr:allantoicase [Candidatus Obscuribacterales bacterium]